jgi:hypothetical protein
MFVEPCPKIEYMRGTTIGLALKPVLRHLYERRYLGRFYVLAARCSL